MGKKPITFATLLIVMVVAGATTWGESKSINLRVNHASLEFSFILEITLEFTSKNFQINNNLLKKQLSLF